MHFQTLHIATTILLEFIVKVLHHLNLNSELVIEGFCYKCLPALGTTPDNCTDGDLKLVGGTTEYEGTLQVCANGVWGTVCDSGWNYYDAAVACYHLGYGGLG